MTDKLKNIFQIKHFADHLDCDEDVASEWMFKIEGEVVSKPRGNEGCYGL
jgi:hypothetical protein